MSVTAEGRSPLAGPPHPNVPSPTARRRPDGQTRQLPARRQCGLPKTVARTGSVFLDCRRTRTLGCSGPMRPRPRILPTQRHTGAERDAQPGARCGFQRRIVPRPSEGLRTTCPNGCVAALLDPRGIAEQTRTRSVSPIRSPQISSDSSTDFQGHTHPSGRLALQFTIRPVLPRSTQDSVMIAPYRVKNL